MPAATVAGCRSESDDEAEPAGEGSAVEAVPNPPGNTFMAEISSGAATLPCLPL